MTWEERLAAIRAQAAVNCGFPEYPAALIAEREDSSHLREDRLLWANYLANADRDGRRIA